MRQGNATFNFGAELWSLMRTHFKHYCGTYIRFGWLWYNILSLMCRALYWRTKTTYVWAVGGHTWLVRLYIVVRELSYLNLYFCQLICSTCNHTGRCAGHRNITKQHVTHSVTSSWMSWLNISQYINGLIRSDADLRHLCTMESSRSTKLM